jgi:mono/diheme cytochrome c family protein
MLLLLAAGGLALSALAGCSIKGAQSANLVTGKRLFVSKCGSCHTLARAGTKGSVGPNLDDAFHNALASGFQRSAIRGLVHQQILFPEIGGTMPAKLVNSKRAEDIAAYVSYAADRPGQDGGLLATAVPGAVTGPPAVEKNGALAFTANPSGLLAYTTNRASAKPGKVKLSMMNTSGTQHNLAIQSGTNGPVLGATPIQASGTSAITVTLKPGTYTFFCQVPGHRAGGMFGTLTVK